MFLHKTIPFIKINKVAVILCNAMKRDVTYCIFFKKFFLVCCASPRLNDLNLQSVGWILRTHDAGVLYIIAFVLRVYW